MRTHYLNLHVDESADPAVIKASYKVLAQRYHPDRNPEDPKEAERIFKIITSAYEVLSDADKRLQYDSQLRAQREMERSAAPPRPSSETAAARQTAQRSPEAMVFTTSLANSPFGRRIQASITQVVSNPGTPRLVKWLLTPPWRLVLIFQIPLAAYLFKDILF